MTQLKGFKLVTILVSVFKKVESEDKKNRINFLIKLKSRNNYQNGVFESIFTTIISNIQKSLVEVSGWIIDSVLDHNISVCKCNLLAGNSYIRLTEKLDHPKKVLIKIENIDDIECFKGSIVRYLNSVNHQPAIIAKADKSFAKKLDFKDMKFPVNVKDIHKIEKTNSIGICVFGFENKEKHTIYVLKNGVKKNMLIYYW